MQILKVTTHNKCNQGGSSSSRRSISSVLVACYAVRHVNTPGRHHLHGYMFFVVRLAAQQRRHQYVPPAASAAVVPLSDETFTSTNDLHAARLTNRHDPQHLCSWAWPALLCSLLVAGSNGTQSDIVRGSNHTLVFQRHTIELTTHRQSSWSARYLAGA